MHPAFSIVFFTVTSGLGYGWALFSLVFDLTGLSPFPDAGSRTWAGGLALVFVTLGLASSTLHLANPRNAWRAVVRVRTSWLSREAVLALAFYPLFIGYLLAAHTDAGTGLRLALGWLSALVAAATLFATSMIYACLRTIRQWRTPLTPLNFMLIALSLGGLVQLTFLPAVQAPLMHSANTLVMLLLLGAFAGKLAYYLQIGLPRTSSISTATGFRMATVRLLDVGHSAGTFLSDEFCYEVSRVVLVMLRAVALIAGFVVPSLIVARTPEPLPVLGALVLAYVGALVERWLFFAEAQHVVRLYHGQAEA